MCVYYIEEMEGKFLWMMTKKKKKKNWKKRNSSYGECLGKKISLLLPFLCACHFFFFGDEFKIRSFLWIVWGFSCVESWGFKGKFAGMRIKLLWTTELALICNLVHFCEIIDSIPIRFEFSNFFISVLSS